MTTVIAVRMSKRRLKRDKNSNMTGVPKMTDRGDYSQNPPDSITKVFYQFHACIWHDHAGQVIYDSVRDRAFSSLPRVPLPSNMFVKSDEYMQYFSR